MKRIQQFLDLSAVPSQLHGSAMACMEESKTRIKGTNLQKWKTRLFKAKAISKLLKWEDNRLVDVKPEWASHDIAPVPNVTANGDNAPWISATEANPNAYLNKDPLSDDYKEAVARNYWCEGHHPRSERSRLAWYRRNGGEFLVWQKGRAVKPRTLGATFQQWTFKDKDFDIEIQEQEGVWQINAERRLIGPLWVSYRLGYELDNAGLWLPMEGYEFRATLVWTILPAFHK